MSEPTSQPVLSAEQVRAVTRLSRAPRSAARTWAMHSIGKTRTPTGVLNKPGVLAAEERAIIGRHVVDGAEPLGQLPDTPPLAAVVAFEHHLRHDRTGYSAGTSSRRKTRGHRRLRGR